MKLFLVVIGAFLLLASQQETATKQEPPAGSAVPRPAIAAIVDAFRQSGIVGLGDAHGNQLGETFLLALIRDPSFRASGQRRHRGLGQLSAPGSPIGLFAARARC